MLLDRFEEVEAVAARLPYVSGLASTLSRRPEGSAMHIAERTGLNDPPIALPAVPSLGAAALTVSRNASAACDSSPLRRKTRRTCRGDPRPGTLTAAS